MFIPRSIVIPVLDFLAVHSIAPMTVSTSLTPKWLVLQLLPSLYPADTGTKIKVLGIKFYI